MDAETIFVVVGYVFFGTIFLITEIPRIKREWKEWEEWGRRIDKR